MCGRHACPEQKRSALGAPRHGRRRLAAPPPPVCVCGEWRDSLIKFQATSGASDKGQLRPPRPQPIPQARRARAAGELCAPQARPGPFSSLPAQAQPREGGAAPARVAEAVGVGGAVFYIRVDEMMAREVCG